MLILIVECTLLLIFFPCCQQHGHNYPCSQVPEFLNYVLTINPWIRNVFAEPRVLWGQFIFIRSSIRPLEPPE